MASVRLDFVAPEISNLAKLIIYESDSPTGTFSPIEVVTSIGTYPNYISFYTTENASGLQKWFAILWEDDKGAQTELSSPVQGGTSLLIGQLINRVLLRDPKLNEKMVSQECETVLERYFKSDPYSIALTANYTELRGLTNLALAKCYIADLGSASTASQFTAGLVSIKFDESRLVNRKDLIQELIKESNKDLGTIVSVILQMDRIEIIPTAESSEIDQSRLLVEIL